MVVLSALESTLVENFDFGLSTIARSFRNRFHRPLAPHILANHFIMEAMKRPRPNLYNNIHRELIRALRVEFGNIWHLDADDGVRKIECWHATMERARAELLKEKTIHLPVMSVYLFETKEDPSRRRHQPTIVDDMVWNADKARAERIISQVPVPKIFIFSLNIWTKHMSDMDRIMEQVELLFNPSLNLRTKYSTSTPAFIKEIGDNSTLKVGDREDRIIRREIEIEVHSYVPSPKFLYTNTGRIQEFKQEFLVYNPSQFPDDSIFSSYFLLDFSSGDNSMYLPLVF